MKSNKMKKGQDFQAMRAKARAGKFGGKAMPKDAFHTPTTAAMKPVTMLPESVTAVSGGPGLNLPPPPSATDAATLKKNRKG